MVPIRDVLGLGSEHRMNLHVTASGNWSWRMPPGSIHDDLTRPFKRPYCAFWTKFAFGISVSKA
ncbi:MAG: hypothetical protein IPG67_14865 [Acidobacteria bacterium]|nr:hypothetical protein [Acidobacteriota bacterium]